MSSGHNCYNAVDKVTVLVTVVLTELFNNGVHGIENKDSVTSRDVSSTLVAGTSTLLSSKNAVSASIQL